MPSIKEPELSDVSSTTFGTEVPTQFPVNTRRRVWVAPHVTSHAAIILTAKTLYLVSGTNPPSNEVVQAIQNGADPTDIFGHMAIVVSLASVRNVTHDLLTNSIHLDAQAGSGQTGTWSSRSSIVFGDSESADSLFAKLWRRLGDNFKLRQERPALSQWMPTPLAALAGIVIATLLMIMLVNLVADTGSGQQLPNQWAFLGKLHWRWVAVAGGILAAVVQVWIYRRATQPPVRLELFNEK